jgi:hypothetical protein
MASTARPGIGIPELGREQTPSYSASSGTDSASSKSPRSAASKIWWLAPEDSNEDIGIEHRSDHRGFVCDAGYDVKVALSGDGLLPRHHPLSGIARLA